MEKIRKGNTTNILWEIVTKGSEIPYDLTGKDLTLYLCGPFKKEKISQFSVSGNAISWTYQGKDQIHSGVYSLMLVENEGKDNMFTADECSAFELVNCSHLEGGESESHVSIETISLRSAISVNSIKVDQELNENSSNPVSNSAVTKGLNRKVDKVDGKGLSSNDFTDDDKEKLDSLENYDDSGLWDKLNENEGYISQLSESVEEIRSDMSTLDSTIGGINADISALDTKVEGKASPNGTYPNMTVGLAEDLGGRPYYDESEFTFRASAGSDTSIKDGLAEITVLHGNAVVWNQKVQLNSGVSNENGITFNTNAENHSIVANGVATNGDAIYAIPHEATKNHVYIMMGCPIGGSSNTYVFYNQKGGEDIGAGCVYREVRESGVAYNLIRISQGVSVSNLIFKPRIIDLTKMFGAGNEPTTIEEYEARKPIVADEYAYNEGEVIPFTAEGIKSVGDNAWDEEWEKGGIDEQTGLDNNLPFFRSKFIKVLPNTQYYFKKPLGVVTYLMFYDSNKDFVKWLDPFATVGDGGVFATPDAPYMRFVCLTDTYNNDITISLYHSGWKAEDAKYQPYWDDVLHLDARIKEHFPDGMMPWNKVYNKNGKGYIVKGTGAVKIKDLSTRRDAEGVFISSSLPFVPKMDNNGYSTSLILARFTPHLSAYAYDLDMDNRACIVDRNLWMNGQGLSAYANAQDFVNEYGEDVLYYQLAEPTIIEYDEPFNLVYRVADFGTEEVLAENQTAPIKATIQYDFNANDTIRTNKIAIRNLERKVAELTSLLTQMAQKVKEVE